jgi:predicted DNA-binding WGR domain protein
VDHLVPKATSYKVVLDQAEPLSAYLMCSDINANHNKFYIV